MRIPLFLGGLFFCASSPAASVCPIEQARYDYSAGQGGADFKVIKHVDGFASPLVFHLSLSGTKNLWFLFDQGNARYVGLISIKDPSQSGWSPPNPDGGDRPIRDQKFFAWNDDLKIFGEIPVPGSPAPKFILVPDLPETLQASVSDRMFIGSGIFKLVGCDR